MDSTIRNKTISGVIWKAMESGGNQLVKLIISVVIARVLDPANYKTLATLLIVVDLADVIVKRGFVTSLIQRKDADNVDFSSVLWIMLAVASIFYIGFYVSAPSLAKVFKTTLFVPAMRVVALSLFFGAFNSVQGAIIQRKLEFRKFCMAALGATLISGTVGITMAYAGYGVWALVAQQIIGNFSNVVILWLLDRWKPSLVFSLERVKAHFSFGWKMLLSSLLERGYGSISGLILSARFSDSSLSYYSRGKQYPGMISEGLNSVALSVLFPAYARHQDDLGRLREMVRKTNRSTSLMIFPMMAGLAAIASPFMHVLFTDKWMPTVPYLQMMCLAYACYPSEATNLQAMIAMGRSDSYLIMEVIKKIFGLAAIAISVFVYGTAIAISWSYVVTCLFSMVVTMVAAKQLLVYRWRDQIWDMTPPLLLSAVMWGAVYGVSLIPMPELPSLILQVVCGIAVYLGLAVLLKLESFSYLWNTMKSYFSRNRKEQEQPRDPDDVCGPGDVI